MALSGVEGSVGGDAGDLLIGRDLVAQFGQHPSPVHSNRWRLPARHLRRRWWCARPPGFPGLSRRFPLSATVPFACRATDVVLAPRALSVLGPRSCQWWCHWSEPHWRRRARRVVPPCLRAFHSASPSTLMPVRSISRCSAPWDPRYGFSFRVFWRRLSVLKFGTTQSRSIRRNRLSTNPPRHGHSDQWRFHGSICLSAMPNSTFIVRQVWIAASL